MYFIGASCSGLVTPWTNGDRVKGHPTSRRSRGDDDNRHRMFDHVTVRVPDLAAAERRFQALLDTLAFDETLSRRNIALWDDFALTQAEDERRITERAHVAFAARSRTAVEEFWRAGVAAGLEDCGEPGPRPDYGDDYHAAFVRDDRGNVFEAVHRAERRSGRNIDHIALRVADLDAAAAFYRLAGAGAGFRVRHEEPGRTRFAANAAGGGYFSLVLGPVTTNLHVAFPGDDDAVRAFYERLVAAGHRGNGGPGERDRYHAGYYAAYVLDPDGNNIEVVNHHRG
jgi:catechol 2,3-dioxygenase-like lactoylglutathione lyase family enzyme